tara:strand:- start:52 stop:219 length:168 start_codon:yes stop_codon:yes gene_type:complete
MKITRRRLKQIISEEIYHYFKKNKEHLLEGSDIKDSDFDKFFLEILERSNGKRQE